MIALAASFFLLAYVLIPGSIFRAVFCLFVPLKTFQRTRTEEIKFSVYAAVVPFLLAFLLVHSISWIGNHPWAFTDSTEQKVSDYRLVFAAIDSESIFREKETLFWESLTRVASRQGRMLCWYYCLLGLECLVLGFLSSNFGRLEAYDWYRWIARKILFPSVSEWHILLTKFAFPPKPERRVLADVLQPDNLYRGEIGDWFLDRDGKLTGIILNDASRFNRRSYLRDKDSGTAEPVAKYWKAVPGKNLYIPADKITNLNLSYEPEVRELLQETLESMNLNVQVTLEPSPESEDKKYGGANDSRIVE